MQQSEEIKSLIKFIKNDPTRKVSLAAVAGVSTTSAVDKWIERNRLPPVKRMRILKFIERGRAGYGVS